MQLGKVLCKWLTAMCSEGLHYDNLKMSFYDEMKITH